MITVSGQETAAIRTQVRNPKASKGITSPSGRMKVALGPASRCGGNLRDLRNLGTRAGDNTVDVVSDDDLVERVAAGDREALAELYRRHAAWIGGRLAGMTVSHDLAEEALQDTFLTVWRRADSFRSDGPLTAWLWGIARRRLVSLVRRAPRSAPNAVVPWAEGPEDVVLGEDEATRVRSAVAHLPADQREVIEAVVFRSESVLATARALNVAEGTVKSRLHRARARLRAELQR